MGGRGGSPELVKHMEHAYATFIALSLISRLLFALSALSAPRSHLRGRADLGRPLRSAAPFLRDWGLCDETEQ